MWLYKLLLYVTSPIVHFFWLEKVVDRSNVTRRGPVIVAPNHSSWIDPFFITTAVKYRRFYFLIGEFIYKNKIAKWGLNIMDHIPVDRYLEDKSAVYDKAKKILDKGGAMIVFPEGRLTKDGYTQKGFKGVAKMAMASKADIVPAVITNSYQVFPVHQKKPKFWGRRICQVKFLSPIKYETYKNMDLEHIVHNLIMKEIAAELGHEYNHTGFDKDVKAFKS